MTAPLILSFVGCLLAIGTISGARAFYRDAGRDIEQHVQTALNPTATEADIFWRHYFADQDAADDRAEDRLDRELRDGLRDWGRSA